MLLVRRRHIRDLFQHYLERVARMLRHTAEASQMLYVGVNGLKHIQRVIVVSHVLIVKHDVLFEGKPPLDSWEVWATWSLFEARFLLLKTWETFGFSLVLVATLFDRAEEFRSCRVSVRGVYGVLTWSLNTWDRGDLLGKDLYLCFQEFNLLIRNLRGLLVIFCHCSERLEGWSLCWDTVLFPVAICHLRGLKQKSSTLANIRSRLDSLVKWSELLWYLLEHSV